MEEGGGCLKQLKDVNKKENNVLKGGAGKEMAMVCLCGVR